MDGVDAVTSVSRIVATLKFMAMDLLCLNECGRDLSFCMVMDHQNGGHNLFRSSA